MSFAKQAIGLRPSLPVDMPVLAAIYAASVEELTSEDYGDDARTAWAAVADDETAFAARLSPQLTLIASIDGAAIGFASLKDNAVIDMLYVHPQAARQGVARALCDALEKLAAARGATALTTDASDTAQPFFAQRGYVPTQRNTVSLNGEWLASTTMRKELAGQTS